MEQQEVGPKAHPNEIINSVINVISRRLNESNGDAVIPYRIKTAVSRDMWIEASKAFEDFCVVEVEPDHMRIIRLR
jgi:hypothetical protein